jgi:hypothetical protein
VQVWPRSGASISPSRSVRSPRRSVSPSTTRTSGAERRPVLLARAEPIRSVGRPSPESNAAQQRHGQRDQRRAPAARRCGGSEDAASAQHGTGGFQSGAWTGRYAYPVRVQLRKLLINLRER